jgi:DinB superfamily
MRATEFIKMSLENSKNWAMGLLNDMRDEPLTQPTTEGGNHPLWVLGHLVFSESQLLDVFLLGQRNRFPELVGLFDAGTTPCTDAGLYPTMDELFVRFQEIRAASLAHLEMLNDDDLDKRSQAPEDFGPFFATVGACFAAMSGHVFYHSGQVADARRAAGRSPLMA